MSNTKPEKYTKRIAAFIDIEEMITTGLYLVKDADIQVRVKYKDEYKDFTYRGFVKQLGFTKKYNGKR